MKIHNYQWSIIQTSKQNYLEVLNIDRIPTINEVFLIYIPNYQQNIHVRYSPLNEVFYTN